MNWEHLSLIKDDVMNVVINGSFADRFAYTIVFLIVLGIVSAILFVAWFFLKAFYTIFAMLFEWTDKDYRLNQKAKKYEWKKEVFNRSQKAKMDRQLAKDQQKEKRHKATLQKRIQTLKDEEVVAISTLNYGHFLPENGYSTGPNIDQRIEMEEERIRRKEKRALTEKEIRLVKSGMAVDGTPFGSKEHQERLAHLFKLQQKSGYISKAPTKSTNAMPIQLPVYNRKQATGEVIPFPINKK